MLTVPVPVRYGAIRGMSICVRFPLESPSKQAICRGILGQITPLNGPLVSQCCSTIQFISEE